MLPIGKKLRILPPEINKLDFFDSIEQAWGNVKLFTLKHQLEGENCWFQDAELSSHPSLRKKNCPCCDKLCTPERRCCPRCYRRAQLASNNSGETQSIPTSGEIPASDLEKFTVNSDMYKCIQCSTWRSEQELDKDRLCDRCCKSFNQSERK